MPVAAADTVAQLPGDEKDTAQLTDSPATQSVDSPGMEQVFASAGAKSKPESKSDLSSMFKSLSAKMMMKRERQSRFSDIAPAVSGSSESSGVLTENFAVLTGTDAGTGSSHLLHTLGTSSTHMDTVGDDTNSGVLLPPFSRAVGRLPLAASNRSETSTFGLQNYDMSNVTGGSLPLSSMPVCPPPLPPGVGVATHNSGIFSMTHSAPGVTSSLPGL